MNDGNPTRIEGEPATAPLKRAYDFSILQGLQIVGGEPASEGAEEEAEWAEALRLELEARATRFRQSVDSSIVLANDGVIRWLGDPIAKLARGADLLTPAAVILADSRLPEPARDIVAARLEHWLAALTRRLLGPLFALNDLQQEAEPVRDIGGKLAKALGVLERDGVRGQVKRLDQEARAALRKHGVRFGAHYVYVPTSLKPAARALALQLWSLVTPEADAEALRETLLPLAASGRTSLPVDPRISRDGYRVAGFRACGERAVRVDILERLADLIRAAFVPPNAGRSPPTPGGFAVSGQMTSLAGCSGESFFSILRSLGFESFAVKRSEVSAVTELAAARASEAPSTAAEGKCPDALAPGRQAQTPDAEMAAEPETAVFAEADDPAPPVAAAKAQGGPPPDRPTTSEVLLPDFGAAEAETASAADPAPAEAEAETPAAPDQEPAPTETEAAPDPQAAEAASAAAAEESKPSVETEETIILWRPARRRRQTGEWRRGRNGGERRKVAIPPSPPGEEAPRTLRPSIRGQPPGKSRRFAGPSAGSPEKGEELQSSRPDNERAEEKTHDPRRNGPIRRPKPSQSSPPQAAADPNSPFAKLLELRPLLEKQAKSRS